MGSHLEPVAWIDESDFKRIKNRDIANITAYRNPIPGHRHLHAIYFTHPPASDERLPDYETVEYWKERYIEVRREQGADERLREALEEAEGQFKAIRANLKYGSKDRVEASIGLAEYAAEELRKTLGTQEPEKP